MTPPAVRAKPDFIIPSQVLHKPSRLPRSFYDRPPEVVAPELLGKLLVRHLDGQPLVGRITEVEAYQGLDDPAAHTAAGRTPRNQVLFGPPGFAYVYFVYGMHYCLNFSCLPEGEPGGVLIRALEPIAGRATMAKLRGVAPSASAKVLTGGPGKLCEALDITRAAHNGVDVTVASSPVQALDDGYRPAAIDTTPRIGIRKATERMLRFVAR